MIKRLSVLQHCSGAATRLLLRNTANTALPLPARNTFSASGRKLVIITNYRCFAAGSTDGHEIPNEIIKLSPETYHEKSDTFLENLLDELEMLSDEYPQKIPDIEYSQGVMTLQIDGVGTYVVNKQPPNKQIWLSSPVSGPNRFDLYQDEWISLRDGSKLLDTLTKELNDAIPQEQGTISL